MLNKVRSYCRFRRIPFFVLLHDSFMVMLAFGVAYWLRFNMTKIPPAMLKMACYILPFFIVSQILSSIFFGLYRGMWSYFSMADVKRVIISVFFSTLLALAMVFICVPLLVLPRTVPIIYSILLINLLIFSRLGYRLLRERQRGAKKQRVMIVGAGNAGEGLVRDMLRNSASSFVPVMFIDDKARKFGQEIHGVKVFGPLSNCQAYIDSYNIDLLIIAMPSADRETMQRIMSHLNEVTIPIRILPSLDALANGLVSMNNVRDISLEDLLERDIRQHANDLMLDSVCNKSVLVTGGGGSIGSELCLQIAALHPATLIIIDNCEFNLYRIEQQLRSKYPKLTYILLLDTIVDAKAMQAMLKKHMPEVVFHAAAYKHVPILEAQAKIAIKNNILGTQVLAQACLDAGIKKFVMISTDKAVNPSNVMGASKRIAELICLQMNSQQKTKYIIVRFGNVLGSSGSVVPLFKKQIAEGRDVTVTHPDVTRYFMTIPEAGQLILQAAAMGAGGEVFVLDMGEPVSIRSLAENMIRLSGHRLNSDIKIVYTGLRAGEKLHEELFYHSEALTATENEKIRLAAGASAVWKSFSEDLDEMLEVFHSRQPDSVLKERVFDFLQKQLERDGVN